MSFAHPINWPGGREPLALTDPVVVTLINRVLRYRGVMPHEEMAEEARRLLDYNPPQLVFGGSNYQRAAQLLGHALDLELTVDIQKQTLFGARSDPRTVNRLAAVISEEVAERLPLDKNVYKYLWRLVTQVEAAAERDDKNDGWFYAKVFRAYATYQNRLNWVNFVKRVFTDETMAALRPDGEPLAERDVDQVAATLNELRWYGVKSCYMQDDVLNLQRDMAWVFVDGFLHRQALEEAGMQGLVERMADFYLTDLPISDLTIKHRAVGAGSRRIPTVGIDVSRHLGGAILPDGHLESGLGWSIHPISKYFQEAGRPEAYQVMRVMQLMRLFDLTVPVKVVQSMGPAVQLSHANGKSKVRERAFRPVRELWLPRLQAIAPGLEVLISLIRDESTPVEPVNTKPTATHTVNGFFRPLLPGQHSSPEALVKLRKERPGAEMKVGHTFVKTHDRGSGPRVTAHEAKER